MCSQQNLLNFKPKQQQQQQPSVKTGEEAATNDVEKVLSMDQDCPVAVDESKEGGAKSAKPAPAKALGELALDDDENETIETIVANLPDDLRPLNECMHKAQACCLLLILKHFLKEVYSINESKIENYSPADLAKVNDRPITSRKSNRRFNPKTIVAYMARMATSSSANSRTDTDEWRESLAREYLEVGIQRFYE